MKKIGNNLLAGFMAAMLMGCAGPLIAGEQPNIIIMGEDWDTDTVPRKSRVFNRVLDAIVNELNNEGFDIYDETAITMDGFAQGRVRRSDAEVIDIARSVKHPPIDIAVLFQIYSKPKNIGYTMRINPRVRGRMLNVLTGKKLGNFEAELPQPENVPPNCDRHCQLEAVGKHAKTLGMEVGAMLALKLDDISPASGGGTAGFADKASGMTTKYVIIFSGFTPDDITAAEEYLPEFEGYKNSRPISQSARTSEYLYETTSKSAKLVRNLRLMLDYIDVKGRVTFRGAKIQIDKIAKRKQR